MRRGSAVRSVYGYLASFVKKYPNVLNYIFPSKRRIQENTYKWIRVDRKSWFKSDEHYSRRQIYAALRLLRQIDAIRPSQKGWIIMPHGAWTEQFNGVCRVRHLERILREEMPSNGEQFDDSAKLLAPVLPKNASTRVSVLNDMIRQKKR